MSRLDRILNRKPVELTPDDYASVHPYKTMFSMVGPVGSGKSVVATGTVVMAETMSAVLGNFYCRVLLPSGNIIKYANNLRLGHFPPKTDPYAPRAFEAGLMICERGWHEKKVQVPLCDVGGEVFDALNPEFAERARNINRQVVNHVRDCQGFVLTLPAPDAQIFRTDINSRDPDAYLYTVMSQIMDYKLYARKKMDGVGVWITRWDEVMDEAKDIGMDIYADQRTLDRFFENGYPALAMLLKPLRDAGKVRYFKSYFKIKKREDGTEETWPDGSKRINVVYDPSSHIQRKPDCAEQDYVNFIRWLGSFAN